MIKKLLPFAVLITLIAIAITVCNCNKAEESAVKAVAESPEVEDDNIITFVTLNSQNTYYVNSDKEFAGFEYDLANLFVQYINDNTSSENANASNIDSDASNDKTANEKQGTKIKFIVADSIEEAIAATISKKADITAADLTVTEARKNLINFSAPYQDVQQQIVYSTIRTKKPAKSASDLVGTNLVVPAASSFVERLKQLKKETPNLAWEARESVDSEKLIEDVARGRIQYTIADSHLVSILRNFHPNLRVAFSLGQPEKIAWGFSKTSNPKLLAQTNAFFTKIKKDGTLRNLIDRYYGNSDRLKPIDVKAFLARSHTRMPKYEALFKQAQEITGLDWRLLASVSYRESHWDTYSTSPTGVRGLMMLTGVTADRMGVTDRLDPKQSIPAGAKYINLMLDRIPDRIPEPDRTYMALAAYNIGYSHVEDARILAQRLKISPDRWVNIKKTLVMLRNPKYYKRAKYGYCRGGAPVIYVESIRSYYSILSRFEPPYEIDTNDPYKIAQN